MDSAFSSRKVGDVIAEINMLQTTFAGCYLLLEGPTDSKFFRPRTHRDKCQHVICGKKDTVIAALRKITTVPALGIVDDDFDTLRGINHQCNQLLATDTHDLETLMLSSAALNKVLMEYADMAKVDALAHVEGRSFEQSLLARALPFGILRYLSITHNLGIDFDKEFSPWKFIDKTNWHLDQAKLFAHFFSISQLPQQLYASAPINPAWNMVQGHDVIKILSIAFEAAIKDHQTKKQLGENELAAALRLAFDNALFSATSLHQKIQHWEQHHTQTIFCQ